MDILKEVLIVLVTVIISMTGFWLMIGRNFITREEAALMIKESNAVLNTEITHLTQSYNKLAEALNKHSEAVTELRIAIAKLLVNNNNNE